MRIALFPVMAAALISGCAGGPVRKESFAGFEPAPRDKALVYFYRPKAFTGGGVWYDIKLSDRVVAALENCSFSKVVTAAGTYGLSTAAHPLVSGAPDPINISVVAGERYFYLLDINGSFAGAAGTPGVYGYTKIRWLPTSSSDAETLLSGCKRVEAVGG